MILFNAGMLQVAAYTTSFIVVNFSSPSVGINVQFLFQDTHILFHAHMRTHLSIAHAHVCMQIAIVSYVYAGVSA